MGAIATGPKPIRREVAAVGTNTAVLVDVIRRSLPRPERGFRSGCGLLGLVNRFGAERVAAAGARALGLATRSDNSLAVIRKNHRENAAAPVAEAPIPIGENVAVPATIIDIVVREERVRG